MANRTHAEVAIKGGAAIMVAMAGAAKAQDLQGLYGGLGFSRGSGDVVDGGDTYVFDGNSTGIFLGYNHVAGDWLFGGELALSNGALVSDDLPDTPDISAENIRDIKLRVGRVFGKTLIYGVVGRTDFDFTIGDATPETDNASATAVGLGFEAAIGAKGFVGGEYLMRRSMDFDGSMATAYAGDGSQMNTLSLRLGLRF